MTETRDQHLAAVLGALARLSGDLAEDVAALDTAAWDGPTNCPPWTIHDLLVHVVSTGEAFAHYVRRGLAGSVEPDVNTGRRAALEAATPDELARALSTGTADFIRLYDGLSEAELDRVCWHRRGNRSVRWYATHRLAEVAFHGWDFLTSTGHQRARLDDDVGSLLLPTLLESNLPRTYAAGLSSERGRGERFCLAVAGDATASWVVTLFPERAEVERAAGDTADLAIRGAPAALCLLVYGRQELPLLVASGAVDIDGDPLLVERFAAVFPRP